MIDPNDLSDDELSRVLNTPLFRRALAYKRLADGVEWLRQDDELFDQLARDVNAEAGGRTKVATTKKTLEGFVAVVERYTSLVDDDGEAPDFNSGELADLIVDEDDVGGDTDE